MAAVRILFFLLIGAVASLIFVWSLYFSYDHVQTDAKEIGAALANTSPQADTTGYEVAPSGAQVKIPVLCYHGTFTSDIAKNHYNVPPNQLRTQMKYLYEAGYKTISIDTFYRAMRGEPVELPAKPILITFDDGKKSDYTQAYPIMKEYGFKAVLFIYPTFIMSKKYKKLKLSWEQLRFLEKNGFEVQSHTYWHPRLYEMSREDQIYQFKMSKKKLEKELNKEIRFLAYPFGGYNKVSIEELKKLGYLAAFSINPGLNYPGKTPLFHLKRYMLSRGVSTKTLKFHLETESPINTSFLPEESDWIKTGQAFQFKGSLPSQQFDRVVMRISGKKVTLKPNSGGEWTGAFPKLSTKRSLYNTQLDFYDGKKRVGYENIVYNNYKWKKKAL